MAASTTSGTTATDEHEVPLFHPSPCAHNYYVQSPSASAASHPASESMALILSPFPNLHHRDARDDGDELARDREDEAARRLALSLYSSSRGSNTSFPVVAGYDDDKKPSRRRQTLTTVRPSEDDEDEGRRCGAWRYVKLDPDAPRCCVALQVAWRVAASAAVALLVFVLATRPRRPGVSFRVAGVERFALGEGLDGSGVETSFLDCNCSVDMVLDNRSKVFGLRVVSPPMLQMSFGSFVFATNSQRGEGGSYDHEVPPRATSTLRLFVAAQEKPMYAAGRGMQDLLASSRGLPLTITVRSTTRYRIVGSLVRLTYRHNAECVVRLRRSPHRNNAIATAGATCAASS